MGVLFLCGGWRGRGVYRTPNGLVHILIPEKLKNEILKNKNLKIKKRKIQNLKKKKFGNRQVVFFFEIFDLRRYFYCVGTSVHFIGKSVLEGLKSGLELKFVIILYFRVHVYMRLRAFCFMPDCFL